MEIKNFFLIACAAMILVGTACAIYIPENPRFPEHHFPAIMPAAQVNNVFPSATCGVNEDMLCAAHNESDLLQSLNNDSKKLAVVARYVGTGSGLVVDGMLPSTVLITVDGNKENHTWVATDTPALVIHEVLIEGSTVKFGRSINISAGEQDSSMLAVTYGYGKETAVMQKTWGYDLHRALQSAYGNGTDVVGQFGGDVCAVKEDEFDNFCDAKELTIMAIIKEVGPLDAGESCDLLKALGLPSEIIFGYDDEDSQNLGVGIIDGDETLCLEKIELTANGIVRTPFAHMNLYRYEIYQSDITGHVNPKNGRGYGWIG